MADEPKVKVEVSEEEYKLLVEYRALCHAMQTGVASLMPFDGRSTEPKHLRVGINVALSDHGALVGLLVKKGIIQSEEYAEAIRDNMQAEVERYEKEIRSYCPPGTAINLI